MYEEKSNNTGIKLIAGGIAVFIIIIILFSLFPFSHVGAGERGVIFSNASGVQDRILGEGWHSRKPFIESVKLYSVKVQKDELTAQAASKDLQTVQAKIVVNWHLDAKRVNKVYQEIGSSQDVVDRIILPNTNEVVKASTAKYTAEETLTKRAALKQDIDVALSQRLKQYFVVLDDVSIVDVDFSAGFNQAIERKAQAEQDALAEKNKLESIKYQAQQKIETAKADAESIKIKNEALAQNPALIEYTKAQRWNGQLPSTILGGDTIPFFNLNK